MTGIAFLLLPILGAAVAYALRRWRAVPALLVTGVSLTLGLILLLVPSERPLSILGREIVLGGATDLLGRALVFGASGRAVVAFLFLAGAALFLLAWQVDPGGLFAPLGLGLLGLLGGAVLIRPLIYASLLLEIAAALSIFPLHSDPRFSVRGGLRYLTFFTLALPGLLVSHWLLDLYTVTPDQAGLLTTATALIGFSFALMLGVVPFHPWVPAVGRDSAPLASAFLFSVSASAVWFLLVDYLQTYPWLTGSTQWSSVVISLGLITAGLGGLLATARRGGGALMGYAMMVDTGLSLVALGLSSGAGLVLGVAILFTRAPSVALMAAGLAGLWERGSKTGQEEVGLGLRAPWSTAALIVGGLSLAGFPPTVGFATRWGLYRLLFRTQLLAALVLLLASMGLLVGLLRLGLQLFSWPVRIGRRGEEGQQEETPSWVPESPTRAFLLALFIAIVIGLGFFPQALMAVAARVGATFTVFAP